MLTRNLSRQILARRSVLSHPLASLSALGGTPVVESASPRRFIMTEDHLSPMEELSGARQKLRQVLLDYRNNK